jgi:LEA14-like dessication related protein
MKKLNQKKGRMHHRILFLFALSIFLVSCLSWVLEKPSFVLREIILSPRSFTEMSLLLGLEIQNPNRLDLTLKSFEYTVYLNKEEIGNGRLEKELLIPSSSITQLQVPVAAKFKDLGGSLKTIITGDDLPYTIEGKADVKTAFGSLHFPFSKEGRINLRK